MCVRSGAVSHGSGEHAHPHHRGCGSGRSGADRPHRVSDRQEEDTRRIPDHLIIFILRLRCDRLQLLALVCVCERECVCVCVCERESERERVCVCVRERERERESVCVCVCV